MPDDTFQSADRATPEVSRSELRPVVALTRPEARDAAAILRALALSVARRVPVEVVLCVPPPRATSKVLFPERGMQALRAGLGDERRVRAATRWVGRIAPRAAVRAARGSMMAIAREVGRTSSLLVLSSRDVGHPQDAIWLATELDVPVLVARPPREAGSFVAATRFDRPDLPVLARAGELARATETPLFAVHNAEAYITTPMGAHGAPQLVLPTPQQLQELRGRLRRAMQSVEPTARMMVSSGLRTARAVLDAADALDADVIAVGATRREWWRAPFRANVAESVLRGARTSVLVTPLRH